MKKNQNRFSYFTQNRSQKKKEMDKKSRNPMDIKVDIRKESEKKGKEVEEEEKKVERTFVFDDDNQWNQFEVHSWVEAEREPASKSLSLGAAR